MKKIIVTNVAHGDTNREKNIYNDNVFSVSTFWTLNNGLEVQVHYYKAEGLYSSYKSVSVSPFLGFTEKSYTEVRDSLEHVMDAVRAWVNRRNDRAEWDISYHF